MKLRSRGRVALVGLVIILAGCAAATPTDTAVPAPSSTPLPSSASEASPSASVQDVMAPGFFDSLEPGSYSIDPDGDPATSLRVAYDISADGWQQWIGAVKFSGVGHAGLSISTVANLVADGCAEHKWADPPVGPSVDDLVASMTTLAPFEVTSSPADVTAYGFSGKHLAWTVPDLPVDGPEEERRFTGCDEGKLKSWVAFIDTSEPGDAFYGYSGPGYVEEFWILDVDGTRLMIAAETSAGSAAQDVAERDAILDSIRIEP